MTTQTTTAPVHPSATGLSRTWRLALVGFGSSCVTVAMGTFWDLTGNETASGKDDDMQVYPICVGIALAVALLAYGLVVRGAEQGNPSRRSAVLGVLAAASFVVFWAGLPLVLASASVACALVDRDRLGSFGTGSKVGLVGSALAAIAAVTLAIVG